MSRAKNPIATNHPLVRELLVALDESGKTQREVCDKAGIDRRTPCHWKAGVQPALYLFEVLANAIGYDVKLVKRDKDPTHEAGIEAAAKALWKASAPPNSGDLPDQACIARSFYLSGARAAIAAYLEATGAVLCEGAPDAWGEFYSGKLDTVTPYEGRFNTVPLHRPLGSEAIE